MHARSPAGAAAGTTRRARRSELRSLDTRVDQDGIGAGGQCDERCGAGHDQGQVGQRRLVATGQAGHDAAADRVGVAVDVERKRDVVGTGVVVDPRVQRGAPGGLVVPVGRVDGEPRARLDLGAAQVAGAAAGPPRPGWPELGLGARRRDRLDDAGRQAGVHQRGALGRRSRPRRGRRGGWRRRSTRASRGTGRPPGWSGRGERVGAPRPRTRSRALERAARRFAGDRRVMLRPSASKALASPSPGSPCTTA